MPSASARHAAASLAAALPSTARWNSSHCACRPAGSPAGVTRRPLPAGGGGIAAGESSAGVGRSARRPPARSGLGGADASERG